MAGEPHFTLPLWFRRAKGGGHPLEALHIAKTLVVVVYVSDDTGRAAWIHPDMSEEEARTAWNDGLER